MKKSILVSILSLVMALVFVSLAFSEGAIPEDERKRTSLGKYATAKEAYEIWKASQDKVFIIDVRLPEEYVYVGHPPMAMNIPSMLWTGKFDPEKKDVVLEQNPTFVSEVQKRFKSDDKIMTMCRSGHRSAAAAEQLIKAGFTNVFSITDGFEGDKIDDKSNPNHGKRTLNGWRNSQVPWTYDLDIKLIPLMPVK